MLWEKLRDHLIMVFVIKSNFLDKDNKTKTDFDRNKLEKITIVSPEEIMTLLGNMSELNSFSKSGKTTNHQNSGELIREVYVNDVNVNDQLDEPVAKLDQKIRKLGGYKKKVEDNKSYNMNNAYKNINYTSDDKIDGKDEESSKDATNITMYKEICPKMKLVPEFDFQNMAHVWQIVYYRMPNTLSCFKLNIKNVSVEARQRYADFLGNFNDTVTWDKCYLEIQSQGKLLTRRHFLQDAYKQQGLFENVIIDEEVHSSMRKSYVLEKKTVNQWYVSNELLMMRDCDSGDLAVFTKHLTKPTLAEIASSVKDFGLKHINELKECDEL